MNDLRVHDDGPIQLAAPDLERLTLSGQAGAAISPRFHGLLGHRMLR
jgi:hypothetical protein